MATAPIKPLNLDSAWELPIVGVYEENSIELEWEQFEDEACTIPENWADVPYRLAIAAKEGGVPVILVLSGAGITHSGNKLTATITKAQNLLSGKVGTYYYYLSSELGGGITRLEGRGTITVNLFS